MTANAQPGGGKATGHRAVCGPPRPGGAECHARIATDESAAPLTASGPVGFTPQHLQAAYVTPSSTAGRGQTVAVVAAYDAPNVEADLGVYRSQFGLPPCTSASGCFRKVDQKGGTKYPRADDRWAQEIALDLDMVSAVCPNCKILLVEAASSSFSDLGAAVDRAASLGAVAISNSYGGPEFSAQTTAKYASHYNHPGVAITASSGDGGYGVQFPAASAHVTAVGGTTLVPDSTTARGFTESAWAGSGSGCSAYTPKPAWQRDVGCPRRAVADVAAVADPGVAVYSSYPYQGRSGWLTIGGTSVGAPLIAAMYALAGNTAQLSPPYAGSLYSHPDSLFDVATGTNGSCAVAYLCAAGVGYDGPTGLGAPNGIAAF
ncbi:MAG: S8 family serine peptidase [Actinobacteria bacterium]|nr:S8 family serine peptidase [Actinomycetota bacterium]